MPTVPTKPTRRVTQKRWQLLLPENTIRAITLFSEIEGYQDSADKILQARYQKALAALGAGDTEQAIQLFSELGDYMDSQDQWNTLRYQAGSAAMEAQNYSAAIEAFASLGAYEDSADKLEHAVYYWGLALKTSGDSASAVNLLEILPDGTSAKQLVGDFVLSEALRQKQTGALQTAAELFKALGDHAGAKDYLSATYFELLLGTWENESGVAEFAEDNTYALLSETGYFNVDGQTLLTGDAPGDVTASYTIETLSDTQLVVSVVDDPTIIPHLHACADKRRAG